jgi:hypothetical protein
VLWVAVLLQPWPVWDAGDLMRGPMVSSEFLSGKVAPDQGPRMDRKGERVVYML